VVKSSHLEFSLPSNSPQPYSETERAIFGLIPEGGAFISTDELIEKRYGSEPPFNARHIITGTMRNLARKIKYNKEPFRLVNTGRAGPKSMSYSLERTTRRVPVKHKTLRPPKKDRAKASR
jgi:hypothetical protein